MNKLPPSKVTERARLNTIIDLRGPVIVLILAATVVPVQVRLPGALDHAFQLTDFLQNIAGYFPLGIVFFTLSPLRALAIAAATSLFAESAQAFMLLRDPSLVDVIANVTGAAAGITLAHWWRLSHIVRLHNWMAIVAALLASALLAFQAWKSSPVINPRGSAQPGTLEAHWKFDEPAGNLVADSTAHGLDGAIQGGATRTKGIFGGAISFDGIDDFVNLDNRALLRMKGSLTVSAWIRIRTNPVNDAVIISDLHTVRSRVAGEYSAGYQLDTTTDAGPRTIGFKVAAACGGFFARYGATALQPDTWYFVSSVYDARQRTIDVYLNGQQDNGKLVGPVPAAREISDAPLTIGRRSISHRYDFSGLIDDVRIYSKALTPEDIRADMAGGPSTDSGKIPSVKTLVGNEMPAAEESHCSWSAGPLEPKTEEARLPGVVALLAMLSCFAVLQFGRILGPSLGIALGAIVSFLLFLISAPTLPLFNAMTFPLTGIAAAIVVIASRRTQIT